MFLYIVDQNALVLVFVQASFHSIQQNRILSGAVTANRHIPVIFLRLYWLIPNTSRLTSNRKTAQIVTRKSTGGAYAVVFTNRKKSKHHKNRGKRDEHQENFGVTVRFLSCFVPLEEPT